MFIWFSFLFLGSEYFIERECGFLAVYFTRWLFLKGGHLDKLSWFWRLVQFCLGWVLNIFELIHIYSRFYDYELFFCKIVFRQKDIKPYLGPRPQSEVLAIANLWHTTSRIWTLQNISSGFTKWSWATSNKYL